MRSCLRNKRFLSLNEIFKITLLLELKITYVSKVDRLTGGTIQTEKV